MIEALYREQRWHEWRDVELVEPHSSGGYVLRETVSDTGRCYRGVWVATRDQVRLPGPVLELWPHWGENLPPRRSKVAA